MRAFVLYSALLCTVLGQIEMGLPYTVGNAGYGYRLALPDGQGNVILASNPVGEFQTIITKTVIGMDGTPEGPESGQLALLSNKGYVNAGCLHTQGGRTYLYAAMSASGWVARIDISFPSQAVEYLNATDSGLLWNHASPQQFVSIVCQDRYIYFGTTSPSVSNTIVRLDTHITDPVTRFATLGPVAPGDFRYGIPWGTDALFAMEADGDTPLTFYTVNGGPGFALKAVVPAEGIEGYELLAGISGDYSKRRVIVASANNTGRLGVFDLSLASHAVLNHQIELDTGGLSPITSLTVDRDANFAYATVGDCKTSSETVLVSVSIVPTLKQISVAPSVNTLFNCSALGTPTLSFLVTSVNDTLEAPAQPRQLIVATQLERNPGEMLRPGVLVPYMVYSAGPCLDNCNSPNGACAGEICRCRVAFMGATCNEPAPCGGTNCSTQGNCKTDGSCECHVGYSGADCSTLVPCPESCSGQGACVDNVCRCEDGFTGLACHLETSGCESLNECGGHGTCNHGHPVGTCDCDVGFTGPNCGSIDVIPCPSNCTGHGDCNQGACTCEAGRSGADCSVVVPTCPGNCSGRGECDQGSCSCFTGFHGEDCTTVDNTLCLHGCSGYGSCVRGLCDCADGFSGVDCASVDTTLQPEHDVTLTSGENKASTSFVVSVTANEVVFCVASTPGKCIAFDPVTMERAREGTFEDQGATAALLQTAQGGDKIKSALVPEAVSLVQLTAAVGNAPISVSVVDDAPNGFAILGLKANEGSMHGQLIKISTSTLSRLAELEFDDDIGKGVTAGVRTADGSLFFASGNSPGMIYKVNEQLEVVARVSPENAPVQAINSILYDGSDFLVAAAGSHLHIYRVNGAVIEPLVTHPTVVLPGALGNVLSGFIERSGANTVAFLGTSASPAAIIKLTITSTGTSTESIRLQSGENRAGSVVRKDDVAYWGLGSQGGACAVAKVSVSTFRQEESTSLANCAADLKSASIGVESDFVYFGNEDSPARIYSVKLFKPSSCPGNCTGHGLCMDGICKCNIGFTGDACSISLPICPNDCSQSGSCQAGGTCDCSAGHSGTDCSVVEVCTEACQHGHCAGPSNSWPCACESEAWAGTYCSDRTQFCPRSCSNHGSCDHGTCVCNIGYQGEDCSRETYPGGFQRGCSVDADCGTHGVCNVGTGSGTGSCVCAEGWSGEDCDVDEVFRAALETSKITLGMLITLGVLALVIGVVGGVSIYKSFLAGSGGGPNNARATPAEARSNGPSKLPAATTTGYTRFPHPGHRLVK